MIAAVGLMLAIVAADPRTRVPVPPRFSGVGLGATAGLLASAGVGLAAARVVLLASDLVRSCDESPSCGRIEFLGLAQLGADALTMGLSIGAGILIGRRDAWVRPGRGESRRNLMIGGALLMGAAGTSLLFTVPFGPMGVGCLRGCDVAAQQGIVAGVQLEVMALATGLGMMTYGIEYRRITRRIERASRPALAPWLGPDRAGLFVGGRF